MRPLLQKFFALKIGSLIHGSILLTFPKFLPDIENRGLLYMDLEANVKDFVVLYLNTLVTLISVEAEEPIVLV